MTKEELVNVNGYQIYPFRSHEEFLDYLKSGHWNNILVALNAEKIMRRNGMLRELVNTNIGYPDGAGAVYALKKKGVKAEKIPGTEFWLDIINEFHHNRTFYFVGGKQEIIRRTVKKLKKQFPGIQIQGYSHGYYEESEYPGLLKDIQKKKPDIVFVALGSPRQEFVMQEMQKYHKALYMGLGGSFDVYTGSLKRAPRFWIDNDLEWAYRLIKQPKRAFRQIHLLKFAYLLLANKI